MSIKPRDIEQVNDSFYLSTTSLKTGANAKVRLPQYAIAIIQQMIAKRKLKPFENVFPPISLNEFNKRIQELGELAGWVYEVGKRRSQGGKLLEQKKAEKISYRFCDLLSSHAMRRSSITILLMLGMRENVVREISGHAPNSKAFYRYVSYTQASLCKYKNSRLYIVISVLIKLSKVMLYAYFNRVKINLYLIGIKFSKPARELKSPEIIL